MSSAPDTIRAVLAGGRGTNAEWFDENVTLEKLATTLLALANRAGGWLVLGAQGDAPVSMPGVHDPQTLQDRVLRAALAISPALIIPLPQLVQLEGKSLLLVQVPAGLPHVYALEGRYLIREGATTVPLPPQDLRRLLIERGEISFETEIAYAASRDDLDWDRVQQYAAALTGMRGLSTDQVLPHRGCLRLWQGELCPTNAGILLFGKDPQRLLRGSEITAARFAGQRMSDTFTRQDIVGTLPDQIRRAETFLLDHLRKGVRLHSAMERQEQYEYPLEAARELIVNAVAHRDYSISGDTIRLFLFSDRMEVTSPGRLPGPVTIANIKDERFSRNPVIVQVLSDMGFIERLGYGVDRVIELMQRHQLTAPGFEETAGGFRVRLHNAPFAEEAVSAPPEVPVTAEFKGVYRGIAINPRQEVALTHLHKHSRITNSDLQQLCPDVHPETIRRDLADLVTKNILRKLGQKRGSYYVFNLESESVTSGA